MIIVDYSTRKVLQGKLWQYDYGKVLRIQGGNLQKAQEIHFALEETGGNSITRFGVTKDGVTDVAIPDMMLENKDSEVIIRSMYFFTSEMQKVEKRLTNLC